MQQSLFTKEDLRQKRPILVLLESEYFGAPVTVMGTQWRIERHFCEKQEAWRWTYQFLAEESGDWLRLDQHHRRFSQEELEPLFTKVYLPEADNLYERKMMVVS